MKRSGILNPQLAHTVASRGHTEVLCIADSGLPIPPEVLRIDLALAAGVPSFLQTLDAVLSELKVERAVVARELTERNPALYAEIQKRLGEVPVEIVPHEEFKRLVRSARAVVRSGEQTPYANILLFFVTLADGGKAAAAGFNVQLTVVGANNDPVKQSNDMDTAIAQKFSALLLNPTDVKALVPAVERANQDGIPVLTVDRDVAGGRRVAFIGTDNVRAAGQAARTLVGALRRSGKARPWKVVLLEGIPGASSAIERERGFKRVLDPLVKEGTVQIVADLTANFARDQGERVMSDILSRTKQIDAVLAANDLMALGALRAIELAGLRAGSGRDAILLVGFDAIDEAVAMVRQGKFAATVAQAPYVMGYWGVEAAARFVRGQWKPPRFFLSTPVVVVTRGNAARVTELVKRPGKLPGT